MDVVDPPPTAQDRCGEVANMNHRMSRFQRCKYETLARYPDIRILIGMFLAFLLVPLVCASYPSLASMQVSYYPLDGNCSDDSGNGNDLVEVGYRFYPEPESEDTAA